MEDHDRLIRIDERTDAIETMLKSGRETFKTHDERLRDLEQNQSKIMTYIVLIGSGIALGMKALFALWDKLWK